MRIATFDVECTDLAAVGPGIFLCAVVKPLWEEPKTFRYDTHKKTFSESERLALQDTLGEINKYDMIIGHNVEDFDLKWLRTRAYAIGVEFSAHPFTYDTMKAFRRVGYRTAINRNTGKPISSLAFVADCLGIDNLKTQIYPREHWQCVWGDGKRRSEAMDNLVSHCLGDVIMTEKIYSILLPADTRANIKRFL